MNNKKLVLRNSIQKFKQGRKIVKAKWGDKALNPTPIKDPETNEYYFGEWTGGGGIDGTKLIRDVEQVKRNDKDNPFYNYITSSPYVEILRNNWFNSHTIIPEDIKKSYYVTGTKPNIDSSIIDKKIKNRKKVGVTRISFKDAFNNARNSGLKEFTWGGKRFNTMTASEKDAGATLFQNGRWINPNIKFVAPLPTEPTKEEMNELNRKAKPISTWEGASFAKNGGTLKSHKSVIQRFREIK